MRPELLDLKIPAELIAAGQKVGAAADKAAVVFGGMGEAATIADVTNTLFCLRVMAIAVIGFCGLVLATLWWRKPQ